MAEVTGWRYPGTAASVSPGDAAWTDPDNAKADDSNWAVSSIPSGDSRSEWLTLTNFGFTTSHVPTDATILGIEFAVYTRGNVSISSDSVRLLDGDGNADGDDKASDLTYSRAGEDAVGGSDDDWNWAGDDTDVRSSSFGIRIKAINPTAAAGNAEVQYVKCRIHYSEGDALTANDLASAAPVLGTPTLGHVHPLTADDLISAAPVLTEPTIGHKYAFTADDLLSAAPVLGTPTLGLENVDVLAANDLVSAAPVLDEPNIGQEHALSASGISTIPTIGTPTAEHAHALLAESISVTPIISTPAAGHIHNLIAESVESAPVLEQASIGQEHALSASGISTIPTIGTPTVEELHDLTADSIATTPVLGEPTIGSLYVGLRVFIYENGSRVALLRTWEKLYYTRVDSGPSYIEIVAPNDEAAQYLKSGNEILIMRGADDVFTGKLTWGIHEWKESGEQSETVTVRGASTERLPKRVVVRPTDEDAESHTDFVDNAMKAFVRSAYVPGIASAARAITGFSVAADTSSHPDSKTLVGEYQDDLLEKLDQWHDAYGVDWWVDRDIAAGTWEFNTAYPQRGTDKTASVVFSLNRHNVRSLTYTKDSTDLENVVYVGGPGDGANQTVQTVYEGAEPTGEDRYESFIAAPDARFTDDLDMVGEARLAVFGEDVENVEFDYHETDGARWPADFDAGDLVTVYDPIYAATVEAKIEQISIEVKQVRPSLVEDITIRIGPKQADQWKLYENRLGSFSKYVQDETAIPSAPINSGYTL